MKYRKSSDANYDCRYHIVWIIKYRIDIIDDKMKTRLTTILEWICKRMYVHILKLGFEEDHVHMYLSILLSQPIPYVI